MSCCSVIVHIEKPLSFVLCLCLSVCLSVFHDAVMAFLTQQHLSDSDVLEWTFLSSCLSAYLSKLCCME